MPKPIDNPCPREPVATFTHSREEGIGCPSNGLESFLSEISGCLIAFALNNAE